MKNSQLPKAPEPMDYEALYKVATTLIGDTEMVDASTFAERVEALGNQLQAALRRADVAEAALARQHPQQDRAPQAEAVALLRSAWQLLADWENDFSDMEDQDLLNHTRAAMAKIGEFIAAPSASIDAAQPAQREGWKLTLVPESWLDPRDEVNGRTDCDCYSCCVKHEFQEAIAAAPSPITPPAKQLKQMSGNEGSAESLLNDGTLTP